MSSTKKKMKLALIAGAAEAAKYLQGNRMASVEEAIRHVSKEADRIVENIDG